MASFDKKSQVSVAANPIHKFPLHQMHLTTSSWLHFDIAFAKELPANKSPFNHQSFVRCMPLKRPLMSSVQFHKSAYFVPFRVVWPAFTDFLEDTPHVQQEGASILSNTPLISNKILVDFFRQYGLVDVTSDVDGNEHAFDTILTLESQGVESTHFFKFNDFGRHCLKILMQLGYKPNFPAYYYGGEAGDQFDSTDSALPLLTAAKVYIDYFYPSQYAKSGSYINLEGIFNRHYIYTMSVQDLWSVFSTCFLVSYNSDYFVSAFDSALGATSGVVSNNISIKDLSLMNQDVNDSNKLEVVNDHTLLTPVVRQNNSDDKIVLSQFMDDMLKAITNYVRRHALSGSRALERYLADWGIALSADKLSRCYKLGEKHYPLQVSDITSTSDTITTVDGQQQGAALGDFGGRAIAYNQDFNFEVDTEEYGYVLVINTIVPDVSYCQGKDYSVCHKTKMDFLHGDTDGLYNRAISQDELFIGLKRQNLGEIFGFTPVNAELKNCRDIVSGDFVLDTKNVGLLGWSTLRMFPDTFLDGLDAFDEVHNLNFVIANDYDQFNRIFLDSNDDSDKFIIIHRCNMDLHLPAVPLYDYYDFADNKKKILLEVNGAKSN